MEPVDLTNVPVVDNHCHGMTTDQAFGDVEAWRRAFTESTDPGMPREHVATTAFYGRLIRTLAPFLGCEATEKAVFTARIAREGKGLTAELLRAANIDTLLLDTGFPPPEEVFPVPELGELGGCRAEPMLRLEVLMESLLTEHDFLADTEEALAIALEDMRPRGHVALKSIAAYRTGLDIREWPREDAEDSFREYERAAEAGGHGPNYFRRFRCCDGPAAQLVTKIAYCLSDDPVRVVLPARAVPYGPVGVTPLVNLVGIAHG